MSGVVPVCTTPRGVVSSSPGDVLLRQTARRFAFEFRLLPSSSRQIIMNLLWMSTEMKSSQLKLFLGLDPKAPADL